MSPNRMSRRCSSLLNTKAVKVSDRKTFMAMPARFRYERFGRLSLGDQYTSEQNIPPINLYKPAHKTFLMVLKDDSLNKSTQLLRETLLTLPHKKDLN